MDALLDNSSPSSSASPDSWTKIRAKKSCRCQARSGGERELKIPLITEKKKATRRGRSRKAKEYII